MTWWKCLRKGEARVTPSRHHHQRGEEKRNTEIFEKPPLRMFLVNYQTMVRRYGAQRHPRLDDYDALKDSEELVEWRYVPIDATTIYVSHMARFTHRCAYYLCLSRVGWLEPS